MTGQIIFKRSLRDIGNVDGVSIPAELTACIAASKGDTMSMTADVYNGKMAIIMWVEKEGENNDRCADPVKK